MSFVLARWTRRIGSGSNRSASSMPVASSTSRCRIPAARSTRFRLAASDSTIWAAALSWCMRCDHAAGKPTSPPAGASVDASAMECGNHAIGRCAVLDIVTASACIAAP